MILAISTVVEVSMNKIELWISVHVEEWTAEWVIIANNEDV